MLLEGCQSGPISRASGRSGDPKSEARKPRDASTALGQVFTPASLADRMVQGLNIAALGEKPRLLDPCVGPDTFPAALRRQAVGDWTLDAVDIDPVMCAIVSASLDERVRVRRGSYLGGRSGPYDAAILNPPYVRQEWIKDKRLLAETMRPLVNEPVPGTANLYVYFIVKVVAELRAGGRMACLVYDSWQSTLYGRWLRDYLDQHCEWSSEAVPDCPFEGRLIDATIIYATKRAEASAGRSAVITSNPRPGFATIDELFSTRRGLRLKQSGFFMTSPALSDEEGSTRFVKKVGRIEGLTVAANHGEAALLGSIDNTDPRTIKALRVRLAEARLKPRENVAILTWADERPNAWHLHATPPVAPILFNYFMRHRPKHIANPHGIAFSDNFYGLTPKTGEVDAWFAVLNSTASAAAILSKARNQGSGLAKVQLFEYRAASVLDIRDWSTCEVERLQELGRRLRSRKTGHADVFKHIDQLLSDVTGDPSLAPRRVAEEFAFADLNAKKPGECD